TAWETFAGKSSRSSDSGPVSERKREKTGEAGVEAAGGQPSCEASRGCGLKCTRCPEEAGSVRAQARSRPASLYEVLLVDIGRFWSSHWSFLAIPSAVFGKPVKAPVSRPFWASEPLSCAAF